MPRRSEIINSLCAVIGKQSLTVTMTKHNPKYFIPFKSQDVCKMTIIKLLISTFLSTYSYILCCGTFSKHVLVITYITL